VKDTLRLPKRRRTEVEEGNIRETIREERRRER
jgi:hypothetical protein